MLQITNRLKPLRIQERSLETYARAIGRKLKIDPAHQVHVEFVSPARIRKLKNEHFALDEVTDCIAFPTLFPELPAGTPQLLGEIILCPAQIRKQGEENGLSFGEECLFVFTHGVLHLLGHDDDTPEKRRRMHRKQRDLMAAGGYPAGSPRWPFSWIA